MSEIMEQVSGPHPEDSEHPRVEGKEGTGTEAVSEATCRV